MNESHEITRQLKEIGDELRLLRDGMDLEEPFRALVSELRELKPVQPEFDTSKIEDLLEHIGDQLETIAQCLSKNK